MRIKIEFAIIAAKRFLQLTQALRDGKSPDLSDEGPCSRAQILKNYWYKRIVLCPLDRGWFFMRRRHGDQPKNKNS